MIWTFSINTLFSVTVILYYGLFCDFVLQDSAKQYNNLNDAYYVTQVSFKLLCFLTDSCMTKAQKNHNIRSQYQKRVRSTIKVTRIEFRGQIQAHSLILILPQECEGGKLLLTPSKVGIGEQVTILGWDRQKKRPEISEETFLQYIPPFPSGSESLKTVLGV